MVKERTEAELERVLLEALERSLGVPPDERGRIFEQVCGDDAGLRGRLEEMLRLQGDLGPAPWSSESLFGAEAAGDGEAEPGDGGLAPGRRIGAYELVRALARGGMGRVYLAQQADPQRQVALKVFRFELDSEEAARRFRYESQVLARLRHPGIAHVYEAGVLSEETSVGIHEIPWMALEYVPEARPLTEYVREQGLGRRAVLELFLQVLDAVQHGHGRGVIHRDLKPANLLVDGSGRVKVIDFGVARTTDPVEAGGGAQVDTLAGQLVGTARYMSPEQAEGAGPDLDVRTDVYSLGVVLYELLCGRAPYAVEESSLGALVRAVISEEPTRPRRVVPDLDAELEAVVLCALAKDRDQRYASADAFAEDLRRYLGGRPVAAHVSSPGRRLFLFVRRNKLVVGAAAVTTLALVAGAAISLKFGLDEARAHEESEELAQNLIDQSFALFFEFAPQLAKLEGALEVRRAMIHDAVRQLEELEGRVGDDPALRHRLALAYMTLGDVLGNRSRDNVGDLEGAASCYVRSRELFEQLEADGHGERVRYDAAGLRAHMGEYAMDVGDLGTALEHYDAFLAVYDDPANAENRQMRRRLAQNLSSRSMTLGASGDYAGAREHLERSQAILAELLQEDPENADLLLESTLVRSQIGTARVSGGDDGGLDDIRATYEELLGLAEENPGSALYRRYLVDTSALLSNFLIRRRIFDEGEEIVELGVSEAGRLHAAEPTNVFYTHQLGDIAYNRAWLLRERGLFEREQDDPVWVDSLGESLEWLEYSLGLWEEMEDAGQLGARDAFIPDRVRNEIDELVVELESE